MKRRIRNKSGFSLIELTLAVFVFAVGVLTVFLLLGQGLDDGNATGRYTRMAQFGEDVFEALEERSEYYSEHPGEDGDKWYQFWESFASGSTSIVVAAGSTNGVWADVLSVTGVGTQTNRFVLHPWYSTEATGIVSHVMRYKIKVQLDPYYSTFAFTTWTNLARVTLRIWEGQYGRYDDRDSVLFYAWYTDHGGVK
jgi:prepilin-type N-terminal cleavage/methylation domain-containing protein